MKKIAFLIASLGLCNLAQADIANDMNTFFNGMGYASNITKPAAFQSQAAGFFGGGSLFVRTPVHQYQLIQLDLPS